MPHAEYARVSAEVNTYEHMLLMYIAELETKVNNEAPSTSAENQPNDNVKWRYNEDLDRWMGPHGVYLRYDIATPEWVLHNWDGLKLGCLDTRSILVAKTRAAIYLQDKLPTD